MEVTPLKKIYLIIGIHIENVHRGNSEEHLLKYLSSNSFQKSEEIINSELVVYSDSKNGNNQKRTHIIINFSGEISEIRYYTTQLEY